MKRKKFFSNMGNILKFGIAGTILTFIFYSIMTVAVIEWFDITLRAETFDPDGKPIYSDEKPNAFEIMFICALMCSSDIIAAVTIVKPDEQPKLFSIILGEGLLNDAVSIVLFETMKKFALN